MLSAHANMNNKSSHPPKVAINLKQLPPIDPFRIMNSSSSKGKLNNSSTRAAAKVVKPNSNQGMKLVHSEEGFVKNPSFVEDSSSVSSNIKNETCEKTISQTVTDSAADEGMKKGSARSNLFEICAANHWKPPIFECYKEEGPSHHRMFTFKVVIEIEEASRNIIECYGAPHRKKKTAADHAAEGALWRRRGVWRKPLKLSYCAYWYYIELLSKHEHCVWCNNCKWLLEHIWMRDIASWVAAHNLGCRHRSVMELNVTARMDNPKKHGLRIICTNPA